MKLCTIIEIKVPHVWLKRYRLLEKIIKREKYTHCDMSKMPDDRLCDFVALDRNSLYNDTFYCVYELKRRVVEYPFERIMDISKYIGSAMPTSKHYVFAAKTVLYAFVHRLDKDEFVKRFSDEGGFDLIGMPTFKSGFVDFAQNFST